MSLISGSGPVLVVAPHPDDEVLGVGGTMARLAAEGREVHVCVVTRGRPPRYPEEQTATVRGEAEAAHAALGVAETHWLGLPAAELKDHPHGENNAAIGALFGRLRPELVFVPHLGDIHVDHGETFISALVASRPHGPEFPATVLAYETLSETNWNAPYLTPAFIPNVFMDISEYLEAKLKAFELFASQVRQPPHERSVRALRALATLRGATVHREACEGFVLVRHLA